MGIDIDGWVEKNIDGKWVAIARLDDEERARDYSRFDAIRKSIKDGVGSFCLPHDASETVTFWADNNNACSIFCLQLSVAMDIWQKYCFYDIPLDENENNIGKFRVIGWFDQELPML